MRRTLSIAFALLTANAASAGLAAAAAQAPQVWTTNVVAGEFPTQHAALSAVRAKGGIYALAERVERVEQSGTTTTFVYGSNPRNPDIGPWGSFTAQGAILNPHASEEGAVASVKDKLDINGAVCPIKTTVVPKNDWRAIRLWYSGDSNQDARDYSVEYSVPPSCSRAVTSSQLARYRTVECPQYTTWNSAEKACLAKGIAKLSSRPLVCSDCDLRGNPISVSTGGKYQVEADFSLPWLELTRYYHSSHSVPNARLGSGWTHALNMQLFITDSSKAALVLPNGNVLPFLNGYEALDGSGWRIRYVNGMYELRKPAQILKFSATRLVEIDDLRGGVTRLQYDELGRLETAVHSSGRSATFEYGTAANAAAESIVSIKSDGETLVSYDYDDRGRLVSATYPGESARHYFYEHPSHTHALTGIEDEAGTRFSTYAYNEDGLATTSEHAGAVQKADFKYQPDGTTLHTNSLGAVERITFTAADPYRKIDSITTLAGTESWTYAPYSGASSDFRRRVASHTYRSGRVDLFTYQDLTDPVLGEVRIKRRTEASNRPEAAVSEVWWLRETNQLVKQVSSDRTVTWLHNARGQVIQESTITSSGQTRTTTYRYCDQVAAQTGCPVLGLLLSVDGPMPGPADTVTYSYYLEDAPGCASGVASCFYRKGDLWKVANPLGHTIEYLAYDGAGRLTTQSDASGLATSFEYHPRGWLAATRVHGVAGLPDRVTGIEYWPTGLTKRVTQPDGSYVSYTYDAAQRLVGIADNAGNTIEYVLDAAGNRVAENIRDAAGTLTHTQSRVYDALGKLVTQADASDNPTDFSYDSNGNRTSVTDALGSVTAHEYDPLNRLARSVQDVGGIAAESRFKYTASGDLAELADPKGLTTRYARNGFGEVVQQTSPDTGVTTFTYDNAGNVQTRTDARGVTATYAYDALGRTTATIFGDPGADIQYIYDQPSAACAVGERAGTGRLASMIDGSGRTDYCYNAMGDLVRRVQTVEGQALTLRYAYDAFGRLQSMTYPDGSLVDYAYDALGQVGSVGVTPAGGAREVLIQGAETLPFGPQKSWTFGNSRRLDRSYDLDYRPQAISDGRDGLNVAFGFDPVGNINSLTDQQQQDQRVTLNYDALGRLTAFRDELSGAGIEQYSYDATGNRLSFSNSAGVQPYVYPTDSHRLASVDGVVRTYDAMGNTLTIGDEWQYAFDLAGRLGSATRAGSAQASYRHNAAGQRVLQRVGTDKALHLHGEGGEWLGSYGATGAAAQQVVWLGSRPVGLIQAGKVFYIESDHLGSPRAVVDPQRDVAVWRWSLLGEAYGNGLPAEDPDQDGIPQSFDLRFPGQRYDSKSGLSYNYYRDYDVSTGRYVQSDPIGLEGGVATFAYAGSNPIINLDPSGLSTLSMCARPENVLACAAAGIGSSGSAGTSSSGLGAAGVAAAASLARDSAKTQDDCPVQDKCEKIYATIRTILAVVKKRYWDMRQDGMDLFTTRPTGKMSWAGHQQQFRSWQVNLRGYLEVADAMNCKGYPSDAWEWATKPVPTQPAPR